MPQDKKQQKTRSGEFLAFIRESARELRKGEPVPKTLDEWKTLRGGIRKKLVSAIGLSTDKPDTVRARVIRTQDRKGYRIEHLVLQTIRTPDGWIEMPANAYVPTIPFGDPKPVPAVLCVHGHWQGAKQDPVVQARCIGLAKLGFFVLAVDAFGAGERGLGTALGEYHGEMVAATLWPSGKLLAGIQVYENMRAVDYLQSRPEVDGKRLGVTGTSGGGNQTMYVGALDDRLGCVVPVCSVGNYQAYLGAACCMCELVPGALEFSEEWGVLGLVAPRALMVINATRDGVQFSVPEARKSIAGARTVFELYERGDAIRHVPINSGHDYNQPMREAMYGWMKKHLAGEGDGSPLAEPEVKPEDRESVRVWPKDTRPRSFVSLPQFAQQQSLAAMKRHVVPKHAEHWESEAEWRVAWLKKQCRVPNAAKEAKVGRGGRSRQKFQKGQVEEFSVEAEQGLSLPIRWEAGKSLQGTLTLVLDTDGADAAVASSEFRAARSSGHDVAVVGLRATGDRAPRGNAVRRTVDHNASQWAMWIGRPLVTQWVTDVTRTLETLSRMIYRGKLPRLSLVGRGEAGILAILAAALDPKVTEVQTVGTAVSLVSDEPYAKGAIGVLIPGCLQTIGDVPQMMSLLAPRPLTITNPVSATGDSLDAVTAASSLAHTRATYRVLKAEAALRIDQAQG